MIALDTMLKTPVVLDFIFSKDRTTLLLACESKDGSLYWPIHVNIAQEHVKNDIYDQYVRYFDYDYYNNSEHLTCVKKSEWPLTAFYTKDPYVGIMYGNDGLDHSNGNTATFITYDE